MGDERNQIHISRRECTLRLCCFASFRILLVKYIICCIYSFQVNEIGSSFIYLFV